MEGKKINIRMDEDLKIEFEKICSELGLTMTGAFNIFASAVVRKKGMPFEVILESINIKNDELKNK